MYKIGDIEIDSQNPFHNDLLDRKSFATNLTNLIKNVKGSYVISIDSKWGSGKTTFLKMWKAQLDLEEDFETLYFNAWKSDDSSDPLLSLLMDLESITSKVNGDSKFDNVAKYAKPLLKASTPVAIKLLTHGLIDLSKVDLSQNIEKSVLDLAEKIGGVEYENFKMKSSQKELLFKALGEYQKDIGKRIVFFIDELDRCRPSFAIELLERIKHLFSIEDFIFVLSMDREQLASSVNSLYGESLDSMGYLKRFIDFEVKLPMPNVNSIVKHRVQTSTYSEYIDDRSFIISYIKLYIEKFNLSIRDVNQCFDQLNLLIPMSLLKREDGTKLKSQFEIHFSCLYAFFVILKVNDPKLFSNLVNKNYIVDDFEKYYNAFNGIENEFQKGICKKSITRSLELNLNMDYNETPENLIGKNDFDGPYAHYLFDRDSYEHKIINQVAFIAQVITY